MGVGSSQAENNCNNLWIKNGDTHAKIKAKNILQSKNQILNLN